MKAIEYNSIDNVNDRTILVLLKYKKEKTMKEQKLFEKLSKTYVDNFNFEFPIISKLEELGYMSVTNNEIEGTNMADLYFYIQTCHMNTTQRNYSIGRPYLSNFRLKPERKRLTNDLGTGSLSELSLLLSEG